jgi:hypothetical protein
LDSTFLEKSKKEDVQFRCKTLESVKNVNRKTKCVSDQFVKERRLTASKQFSYNKLENEHNLQRKEKIRIASKKPSRPPQPNAGNTGGDKEGILIDLSPEDVHASLSSTQQRASPQSKFGGGRASSVGCILDEPIEIPTEQGCCPAFEEPTELYSRKQSPPVVEKKTIAATITRKPPPYQMPPKYSNTSNFGEGSELSDRTFDPFDTSHIGSKNNTKNSHTNTQIDGSAFEYKSTKNVINEHLYGNSSPAQPQTGGAIAKSNLLQNKPMALSTNDLDELTSSMMASMSPRNAPASPMTGTSFPKNRYESQSSASMTSGTLDPDTSVLPIFTDSSISLMTSSYNDLSLMSSTTNQDDLSQRSISSLQAISAGE